MPSFEDIKRLQGNFKNGECGKCGADKLINLKRQKKLCVITHDKDVRYYLASLTGEADNINDEKVAAELLIYF
jgi:hypothetical protein